MKNAQLGKFNIGILVKWVNLILVILIKMKKKTKCNMNGNTTNS